jgi:hypothetical protein
MERRRGNSPDKSFSIIPAKDFVVFVSPPASLLANVEGSVQARTSGSRRFYLILLKSKYAKFICPSVTMCTVKTFLPEWSFSLAMSGATFQWCH